MKIRDKIFILKGLNYPFLLGMEIILKKNFILNIKNQTITVYGMEYGMYMSKKALYTYDEQLTEITRIYTTSEEDKTLKTLISEFKTQNQKIENITNVNHEIQLSGKFDASNVSISTYIVRTDVRKHIEELEKDGDINAIGYVIHFTSIIY
ncbi:hypothetical protein DMUE_0303 [Dictyocoela muelleri]|nr:hypothetical protein DMUE_0303 [Dictyocoela muelleri]